MSKERAKRRKWRISAENRVSGTATARNMLPIHGNFRQMLDSPVSTLVRSGPLVRRAGRL
jgi:hypothetical protein